MALGNEGRTPVSSRKLESKEGPQGRIEMEETMQDHLLALGTPVTGNGVPEHKIPLSRAEVDPADDHAVATPREGQFKVRKGVSDGDALTPRRRGGGRPPSGWERGGSCHRTRGSHSVLPFPRDVSVLQAKGY